MLALVKKRLALTPVALIALIPACSPEEKPSSQSEDQSAPSPSKEEIVDFDQSIRPILSNKCTICHNSEVLPNRAWFESSEAATKSGMIVPGNPDASRFLAVTREKPEADKAMPPVGHRLSDDEISILRTWITQGANWPSGMDGYVKPAFIPKE